MFCWGEKDEIDIMLWDCGESRQGMNSDLCTPASYTLIGNVWRELSDTLDLEGFRVVIQRLRHPDGCWFTANRAAPVWKRLSSVSFSSPGHRNSLFRFRNSPLDLYFKSCMVQCPSQGHMWGPRSEPTTITRAITLPSVPQWPSHFLQPTITTTNVHVHMQARQGDTNEIVVISDWSFESYFVWNTGAERLINPHLKQKLALLPSGRQHIPLQDKRVPYQSCYYLLSSEVGRYYGVGDVSLPHI